MNQSLKKSFKKALYPANIIVMTCNIIIYIVLQNIFFWYKVSRSVENLIDEKSVLFIKFAEIDEIKTLYKNLLDNKNIEHILEKAEIDEDNRYTHNLSLMVNWNIPVFSVLLSILLISIGLLIIKRKIYKFNRVDFIFLCMVCLAFATEIIFYFIVLKRSVLVSDSEIFKTMLSATNNNTLKKIIINIFFGDIGDILDPYTQIPSTQIPTNHFPSTNIPIPSP